MLYLMQKYPPGPLNGESLDDLYLLRSFLEIDKKLREVSFWEMMHSFFNSISKFCNFKNPFSIITSPVWTSL